MSRRPISDVQPDGVFTDRLRAVREAQGSGLTNTYAGYPGRPYHQGSAPSDGVRTPAIERTKCARSQVYQEQ